MNEADLTRVLQGAYESSDEGEILKEKVITRIKAEKSKKKMLKVLAPFVIGVAVVSIVLVMITCK
ncbi:MAG: hypothetical protein IJ418_00180 [Clostridia bacterium]|nr:hypothetical protein [Clostridia bacterium]